MENNPTNTQESLHRTEPSPVEAILAEVDNAQKAPRRVGLLSIKPANTWIEDSLNTPDPKTYFNGLIVQYENTVIFASSNVGKSIFATQIAEEIAREEKVLYVDLELSGKQFQMRYTDPASGYRHIFPDNFSRAEIDPELIVGSDLEEEILASIEEAAAQGTQFIVVDNITFICNDSEKGSAAGSFMMKLIRLKRKYNLTTIIIAHTPKRRGWEPITQNDLAGSAKLINFFDAGIALARSAKDTDLRYLKQVKVRTGTYQYDSDNVIVYDINKENGFLRFEPQGFDQESNHLKNAEPDDGLQYIEDILQLKAQGKSLRDIGKTLGISLGKVQRKLKKAKEQNLTLESFGTKDEKPVSDVSTVSPPIQTIHPIHDPDIRLPFKDQE